MDKQIEVALTDPCMALPPQIKLLEKGKNKEVLIRLWHLATITQRTTAQVTMGLYRISYQNLIQFIIRILDSLLLLSIRVAIKC